MNPRPRAYSVGKGRTGARTKGVAMLKQLTLYKFEVGFREMREADDGRFDLTRVPVADVEAGSLTKAEIRAIIKDAGRDCPRGMDVYAERMGKVVYRFNVEDLKAIAVEREEL